MEKVCSKCKEVKPFSLFHRHKGKPHGLALWCKGCVRLNSKRCYDNRDPAERLAVRRDYQENNRSQINDYNNSWSKGNLAVGAAREARRRAGKINATPDWLRCEHTAHIKRTYKLASLMKEITGGGYHVDHIVPLQGKNVCGLHVPWNLQVLRADLNLSKSNKFEGDEF
jgi:hypothetical protein